MPSWIRLQAKPTSAREAVLPVSHLWGTIKYLMGLCKKPPDPTQLSQPVGPGHQESGAYSWLITQLHFEVS